MKSFIITIDTEGDNLWAWQKGQRITAENAKFLPRFQRLCEEYGFKPVWLTNFEMVTTPAFTTFSRDALRRGTCEIGMHLHAVNNPPLYELPIAHPSNFPYLIEYPQEIIREKIVNLHKLLEDTYEEKIVSHRAGRWAMNRFYAESLKEHGLKVDCSVTPGINWSAFGGITEHSHGTDYSKSPVEPFFLNPDRSILEVPVSIRTVRYSDKPKSTLTSYIRFAKHRIVGYKAWLRPNGKNLGEMIHLANCLRHDNTDYLMFMLHSSELMPGGSPTFRTSDDIEHLYENLRELFRHISTFCEGRTLKEYADIKIKDGKAIVYKPIS